MSSGLSETRIYRRHAIAGLRWFLTLWFPIVYAMLIGLLVAGAYVLAVIPPHQGIRLVAISLPAWILAFALLTKMLVGFRQGIRQLESSFGARIQ